MTLENETVEEQLKELKAQYKFAENIIIATHAANRELNKQLDDVCERNGNQLRTISQLQDENDVLRRQIAALESSQCRCDSGGCSDG